MSRETPVVPNPVKSGRSGFTFRQLCTVVWSHRTPIAMLVGAAVAVTWLAGRSAPGTYEATATVLVAFQMKDPAAGEFPQALARAYIARQTEAIRSRDVLSRAVEKLDLAAVPGFMDDYRGASDDAARSAWATLQLGERVSVASGEDRFLYVTAEDADAERAADLANAVADAFVEVQQRLSIAPERERAAQLDEGIERLRQRVEEAQAKLTAYAAAHGAATPAPGREDSARAMDLDRRLFEARARRQQAELRLRGMGKDDASIPGAQTIHTLQAQLAEKQAALKKLKPLLGEKDPQYRSFEDEIATTRAKLYEVIVAYQQGLQNDADAARAIERQLEQERQQQRGAALSAQFADGEGAALVSTLDAATQAYQAALDNLDAARSGAGLPTISASLVTRAMPPLAHANPQSKRLLLALVVGLLAGVLLALIRELFDRRIRCAEDFERNLGVPMLAEIQSRGSP